MHQYQGSMMSLRLIILLFVQILSSSGVNIKDGYHMSVGIPQAIRVMSIEGYVSRIVGGKEVTSTSSHPYQAGIVVTLRTGLTSLCGGALVSNTRVITAAHCWWDGQNQARQFEIVLGSLKVFSGGTRVKTSDVTVHPQWNTNAIINDIAIVKISQVTYSGSIKAISLPAAADANQNFAGLLGVATGYGKTSDAQSGFPPTTSLYAVNLNIITNAVCQSSFEITLAASHLCTKGSGVGTCDGDSGGPLAVIRNNNQILVGIVSFGLADSCQSGYPSVYTRVTSYLTWIRGNL